MTFHACINYCSEHSSPILDNHDKTEKIKNSIFHIIFIYLVHNSRPAIQQHNIIHCIKSKDEIFKNFVMNCMLYVCIILAIFVQCIKGLESYELHVEEHEEVSESHNSYKSNVHVNEQQFVNVLS